MSTVSWNVFSIAKCFRNGGLPLFDEVISVPAWRQRYIDAMRSFVDGPFAPSAVSARVGELAQQLRAPLQTDPNRRNTEAQWEEKLEDLVERQAARAANVEAQLDSL